MVGISGAHITESCYISQRCLEGHIKNERIAIRQKVNIKSLPRVKFKGNL